MKKIVNFVVIATMMTALVGVPARASGYISCSSSYDPAVWSVASNSDIRVHHFSRYSYFVNLGTQKQGLVLVGPDKAGWWDAYYNSGINSEWATCQS